MRTFILATPPDELKVIKVTHSSDDITTIQKNTGGLYEHVHSWRMQSGESILGWGNVSQLTLDPSVDPLTRSLIAGCCGMAFYGSVLLTGEADDEGLRSLSHEAIATIRLVRREGVIAPTLVVGDRDLRPPTINDLIVVYL